MKHRTLTSSTREQSRDNCGNLAELDDQAFVRLTQDGPVLVLGLIMLTEQAFINVLREYVWQALCLHHCGRWGACDRWEVIENDEQLTLSGSVTSRWLIQETFEFTIETFLEPGREQTTVSVAPWSAPVCEAPSSLVRLGDVILPDAVTPIPYNRIWSALDMHRSASSGEHDRFPGQCSFPPDSVHISWWGESSSGTWFHAPFSIITLISERPFTIVTRPSSCAASTSH